MKVIGNSPDDHQELPSGWSTTNANIKTEKGWVDAEKIRKYCFPPSDDTAVFVCGLPAMYDSWCGPRGEAELKPGTVLDTLGYTAGMVAKM